MFITSSCEKVIDLETSNTEPKMVIEAKYDAVNEEIFVKISKTVDVFSTEDFPNISGATVQITDENGTTTDLIDQGDGTYLLENYTPVYNSSYSMKVNVEGVAYESSDYLNPIVPLDSLTQELQPSSSFFEGGYVVYMNLTDPVGENYYRAIRKVNGEYRRDLGDQFLFDDGFSEGNSQKVPLFSEFYQEDDTITVELLSYSDNSFTYFQELNAIAQGSDASAAPANPTFRWSNDALGNFSVYGFDSKTIIIEE